MSKKDIVYFAIFGLLTIWGLNNIYFIYQTHQTLKRISTAVEDKEYAKNIELKIYLMTPEQVSVLFKNNPDREPEYWTYPKNLVSGSDFATYHKPLFLVVRLKNEGALPAWGALRYHLNLQPEHTTQILPLPPQMQHFTNYVVSGYLHGIFFNRMDNPEIPIWWDVSYVQK